MLAFSLRLERIDATPEGPVGGITHPVSKNRGQGPSVVPVVARVGCRRSDYAFTSLVWGFRASRCLERQQAIPAIRGGRLASTATRLPV